jgi:hypothetical protein
MRAHEFITEALDDYLEDEADVRGDSNLVSTLETLRNRAHDSHDVPMIRVDSLINIIRRLPGSEMFTVENLLDAYKSNTNVKNLIKDIKDNKDGVKYAYLATFADSPESEDEAVASADIKNSDKTINAMVKRTLSKK